MTLTASMGLKGGCVAGVINLRDTEEISNDDLNIGVQNAIKTAVAASSPCLAREEIFGPVRALMMVKDLNEVLEVANIMKAQFHTLRSDLCCKICIMSL